jgi:hypothetical protein
MPKGRVALAVGIAVALAAPAAGEDGRRAPSDFHRRALIDGDLEPGAAYAVPLTREAVSAYKKGGELRVFDAAGHEVPSLVHTSLQRAEVVERPVTIFNRAWHEDGTQTVSVELTERKPEPANEFVFEIEDDDYNVRVRVEGSEDGEAWGILADGLHLIRHTSLRERIDYRHDTLRIPMTRMRTYRFTLRREPPQEEEAVPLEIEGVKVRAVERRGAALAVPVLLESFDDPHDGDARHHFWKLDLGRGHLGVDRIVLTIPERDFARSASLWEWSPERGRRTRRLANTVLFHYGTDVATEFSGFATDLPVLVLMIDQGDDEPVRVVAARASRPHQQVRFLAPRPLTSPAAVLFDPDEPREPRYDLARTLRERELTSFAERSLGPLADNPLYVRPPEPRSEQIPYLLYLLVIPLVLILGAYVARTIQKGVPPENS